MKEKKYNINCEFTCKKLKDVLSIVCGNASHFSVVLYNAMYHNLLRIPGSRESGHLGFCVIDARDLVLSQQVAASINFAHSTRTGGKLELKYIVLGIYIYSGITEVMMYMYFL